LSLRQATVLVVDDDEGFCTFLSSLLEGAGMEALSALSVEEAAALARERRPDAAIIDVVMPGRGGYGLCRELREEHGHALPVIFVSGERAEPMDRAAGILVGADDYLTKPVHPDELLARLRRLLDRIHGTARPAPTELSKREVEVLQLVAEGWPPAEVARRLFISRKTVSSHIQRIFVKLDVHTRAQAVAVAYEAGLIRVNGNGANGANGHNDHVDVEGHLAAAAEAVEN
jgi:DNA-binding NarL/FixJ family response regulator